jgi:hypothetical protein
MESGCQRTDLFKNSKFSPASLLEIGVNTLDPNHQTGTINLIFDSDCVSTRGVTYKACEPLHLLLLADKGLDDAEEDITSGIECDGQCEFYSDNTCTSSPINIATISKGRRISETFYIKPTAAKLSIKTTGMAPYYQGSCMADIPVLIYYPNLDAQYLWSVNNISELGEDIIPNEIQNGDTWIFQTWEGHRGKIYINSILTSTGGVSGDTLNFTVVTWNAALPHSAIYGDVVIVTETIVASINATDKCYMDLHMTPVVVNSNGKTVDLWWGISPEGELVFEPRNGSVFRKLP